MSKEEKKRTFESEALFLPELKMVLVDIEKNENDQPTKKAKKKVDKTLNEETVMRIIGKLSMKE
jgi:hypothetical protein